MTLAVVAGGGAVVAVIGGDAAANWTAEVVVALLTVVVFLAGTLRFDDGVGFGEFVDAIADIVVLPVAFQVHFAAGCRVFSVLLSTLE